MEDGAVKLSCNFWDVEYHSRTSGSRAVLDWGSSRFRSSQNRHSQLQKRVLLGRGERSRGSDYEFELSRLIK